MKRTLLSLSLLFITGSLLAQQNRNNRVDNRPPGGPYYETQRGVRPCNGNCLCGGQAARPQQLVMNDRDFAEALAEIRKQSFDKDRLRMASYISANNYLNSIQISQIAQQFSFDDSKVAILQAAYAGCVDKGMYFKAINTLSFSSSKDKVWAYINDYNTAR